MISGRLKSTLGFPIKSAENSKLGPIYILSIKYVLIGLSFSILKEGTIPYLFFIDASDLSVTDS